MRDDSVRTPGNTVRTRGLIPWRPGESGNPLGGSISALGLAAEVRRRTHNGRALVDFFMNVLEGRPIERPGRRPLTPNIDHQIVAANWLSDRGYGRPKETLEVLESSQTQRLELLRKLSDDERAQLRAILTKALNGTLGPGSNAANGRGDDLDPAIQADQEITLPDNGTPVIVPQPVNDAIVADDSKSDADRPLPDAAN